MISFPSLPRGTQIKTRLVRVGGDLVSTLGGPTQRITRIGSRFAADIQLPTLDAECAYRWIAAALRAEALGQTLGLVVPQLVNVAGIGAATGTGVAGSPHVDFTGGAPPVGAWFSYVAAGRHYLHTVTDLVGLTAMNVAPLLRRDIGGAALEYLHPTLEGFPDATEWDTEWMRFIGHAFTLTESA